MTKRIKEIKDNGRYAFERGWSQVTVKDAAECKCRLMSELGVTSRAQFRGRLLGYVEPKVSEAERIEAVFKSYGITDVWGPLHKTDL